MGHLLASAGATVLLLALCRGISRVDSRLGTIVRIGVVVRVGLGAALFWISYLNWAPLAHLHSADGFWELAPDARLYFWLAADAAQSGLHVVQPHSPSPTFVRALALWLRIVGSTPGAVVLLNALLLVGACRLVVALLPPVPSRGALAAVFVIVSGLSLSPALILCGAQGLKDQFLLTLLVLMAFGAVRWLDASRASGLAIMSVALLLVSGVRAYVACFAVASVALAVVCGAARAPRQKLRHFAAGAAAVGCLWLMFMIGAGAYYAPFGVPVANSLNRIAGNQLPASTMRFLSRGPRPTNARIRARSLTELVETSRVGFVRAAGATSFAGAADGRLPRKGVRRPLLLLRWIGEGLTLIFLPVSVLQAAGLVEFTGGRGLLFVTDADSCFNLLSVAAIGWLFVRMPRRGFSAYTVYAITLTIVTTLLMAYVVSNFGTLFRLLLMSVALIWLSALAWVVSDTAGHESRKSA